MKALFGAVVAASLFWPALAGAAPRLVSEHKDWNLYKVEGKDPLCYIASEPKKVDGTFKSRGNPFIIVARIQSDPPSDEVSVRVGYDYKEGSDVAVDIDGKKFAFFTRDDQAWAKSPQDDKAVIAAMRAGRQLVARATSTRNTTSIDTYSLAGFSAAFDALNTTCKANANAGSAGDAKVRG